MNDFIHLALAIGGLAAGGGVGAMCVVCLFVWLGGVPQKQSSEAWRPADWL